MIGTRAVDPQIRTKCPDSSVTERTTAMLAQYDFSRGCSSWNWRAGAVEPSLAPHYADMLGTLAVGLAGLAKSTGNNTSGFSVA